MKVKYKKLLAASVTVGVLTPFLWGGGTACAEDIAFNDTTIEDDDEHDIISGGGDASNSENSLKNSVTVNGGTVNGVFGGMSISGKVYKNQITINGGIINGGISGGLTYFPYDSSAVAGDVYDNKITVNNGTIAFVSGGEVAYSYLNSSGAISDFSAERFKNGGNVYSNTVTVNGGEITSGIIGGSALTGSALNNSVNLNGGTISGSVIAGEVRYPTTNSAVTGNSINIRNSPNLSNANLYGGLLGSNYSPTDNNLNIYASKITAKNIEGFGGVNFFVPDSNLQDTSTPILTLTSGSTNLELDTVGVQVSGYSNFNTGDTINLLYNSNGLTSSVSSYNTTVTKGSTGIYGLTLSNNSTELTGTIGERLGDTENVPSIAIPNEYAIDIVPKYIKNEIQTDNYVDDDGNFLDLENDKAQIAEHIREQHSSEFFLNSGYSNLKTKTGSNTNVKSHSSNYDIGLAKTLLSNSGNLFIAPLFEYNHNNYESKLKDGKIGTGNVKYSALGFVARKMNNSGFYYEGSFRYGRAKNDFTAENFVVNDVPQRVSYQMHAPLFATHIRVGNLKRINKNNLLELYGILAYSRQNGMSSDLSTGEHVDFSSVYSHMEKIGYRLTTRTSKVSRIYTGIAFQYDSNSDSEASGEDWSSSTAGAKGASGILEIGWQFKPLKTVPWMIDAYATGSFGYQRGFTAMAKIKKAF